MKKGYKQLKQDFTTVESHSAEKGRLDSEQRIARNILLADEPESFPASEHLSFIAPDGAEKLSASDFIDYRLVDDQLFLCVAAAHGDKVNASLATSLVRSQFRSLAALGVSPERIASAVNDTMAAGEHTPVKLFVAQLDLATGKMGYCNADHPSQVIADDDIHKLSGEEANPVGLTSGTTYALQQTEVAPGSLIFLYSDALTGLRDASQKTYGEKRTLGDALQAKKTCTSPDDFMRRMVESVRRFSGSDTLPNMLAIQYK
jgi:serine phosphatase RsbU (regulator of sigma subunit)